MHESHEKPQTLYDRKRASRVVVFAVPPAEELDIVGPWDVFGSANNALREQGPIYNIELVTGRKAANISG